MKMRKQLEINHGDEMPRECQPVWLLCRILESGEGSSLRTQMIEGLESSRVRNLNFIVFVII